MISFLLNLCALLNTWNPAFFYNVGSIPPCVFFIPVFYSHQPVWLETVWYHSIIQKSRDCDYMVILIPSLLQSLCLRKITLALYQPYIANLEFVSNGWYLPRNSVNRCGRTSASYPEPLSQNVDASWFAYWVDVFAWMTISYFPKPSLCQVCR